MAFLADMQFGKILVMASASRVNRGAGRSYFIFLAPASRFPVQKATPALWVLHAGSRFAVDRLVKLLEILKLVFLTIS